MKLRTIYVIVSYINYKSILGDACTIDGLSGSCKLLRNCAPAIVGLRNGKYPQMCGFSNLDPVVCCVSEGTMI